MHLLIAVGLTVLTASGFWWLWCWALQQLWPGGPSMLINPDFWLFIAVVTLLKTFGGLLFKTKD